MRGQARRAVMAVISGLVYLLVAGCSLPPGVDGALTNHWAAMPPPVRFVPETGVCHLTDYQVTGALSDYHPVSCDEAHITETVHVGEFTGKSAERDRPPKPGSSHWRKAYRKCDSAAADYLGADFRFARLWLGVTVPAEPAWDGGARWFRCDVVPLELAQFGEARHASLAGALADDSELTLGCFEVTLDQDEHVEQMAPVACDQPHHAEFVGVWKAPDGAYPDGAEQSGADQVHDGCRERVAKYVDVPIDDELIYRTGTIADWMEPEDWENGDRKFRCYLWLSGDELTGSLAGAGPDELPVR